MTTEVGSGRNSRKEPGAVISVRAGRPARRSRAVSRQHGMVWLGIGLVMLARVLRSRRFHEQVIIGVVGLGALARLAQENQAHVLARLAAWNRRRNPASSARPRPGQPRAR